MIKAFQSQRYFISNSEKKFKQIFDVYFDPYAQNKGQKYFQILRKNKQVTFLFKAFVCITPIIGGLYLLPGNFQIQILLKQNISDLRTGFYKFLSDYSEEGQEHTKNYAHNLLQELMYLDSQQIDISQKYAKMMIVFSRILHKDSQMIEFILVEIQQLNKFILGRGYLELLILNQETLVFLSKQLIYLQSLQPKIEETKLSLDYQHEINKCTGICQLLLTQMKYAPNRDLKLELYNLISQAIDCHQLMNIVFQRQTKTILPDVYSDLAKKDDELNLSAIKYLNSLISDSNNNVLLEQILSDQLLSNLIKIKQTQSAEFNIELLKLLSFVTANETITYLMKHSSKFKIEQQRLRQLDVQDKEYKELINLLI